MRRSSMIMSGTVLGAAGVMVLPHPSTPQQVARADFAGRFGRLPVGLHPAELAGMCSHRPRLEEARRPKPFINPDPIHSRLCQYNWSINSLKERCETFLRGWLLRALS